MEGDELDDDFLSQIAEAEAKALNLKRRKINQEPPEPEAKASEPEGDYISVLKGSKSLAFQQYSTNLKTGTSNSITGAGGGGGGDTCFKCGKLGHWARDCISSGGGGGLGFGANEGGSVEDKMCKCGLGVCLVLTANTEKNRGRKFYRCPAREENGGCGFFEWCNSSAASAMSTAASSAACYSASGAAHYSASSVAQYPTHDSSFPDVPCPCGAGLCLILTAKTEKNMGQQFYRCPGNQDNSCGFFKWCSERNTTVGSQTNTPKIFSSMNDSNNKSYGENKGNSCFKCGQDGHWARDCPRPSSAYSVEVTGKAPSSGICYKCSKSGHWARDCPGQDRKVGQWR